MTRRLGIILPIFIILVWEAAAIIINNPFYLPKIESVIPVLIHPFSTDYTLGTGSLVDNALVSIERVIIGFGIAAVVAIPLGIGMGRSSWINDFFDTTLEMLRPIPPLAWVPLALAWFRLGIASIVFIIFIGSFFPILLNTIDGVRGVKKTWIEVGTTLGASEWQVLVKTVVPGAAPTVWTGLRVGFGIAWMCVVAAEILPGPTSGLGYLIMYAYNLGQMNVIIAGMITIGLIGLAIDLLFRLVEDRFFRWRGLDR
ncbi:MAG: ABC transporter permease [Methanoregula sp.]|nr:ABC transporter permease [Methanoregula sp.]